jgi:hypothetical protein
VPIDLTAVGRPHPSRTSWSSSQALLYALGVGAGGSDAHDELTFTTENSHDTPQRVLPTVAAVLAMRAGDGSDLGDVLGLVRGAGDFALAQILHGEQSVTLHGALPVAGTATATGSVSAIHDKGRNAVIESRVELRAACSGALLAETALPAQRRPEPAALRSLVRPLRGAGAADPARPVHLRLRRTGPPARGVRRGPRPLRQHVCALHLDGASRRHPGGHRPRPFVIPP